MSLRNFFAGDVHFVCTTKETLCHTQKQMVVSGTGDPEAITIRLEAGRSSRLEAIAGRRLRSFTCRALLRTRRNGESGHWFFQVGLHVANAAYI